MSLPPTLRHNQTAFIALGLNLLILGGFFGCQAISPLFEVPAADPNNPDAARPTPAAAILQAASQAAPPPYKEILLLISAMLTSGVFVDNRRKDTVIKVLQSKNADQTNILKNTLNPKPPSPIG